MNDATVATSILAVGMGCIAAYLNVNGKRSWFVWIGGLICYLLIVVNGV